MKTLQPLILTARIKEDDLAPFDRLRLQHFPSDRNYLKAHLTMFHRLPGEHLVKITEILATAAGETLPFTIEVAGIRHLGAGVAFDMASDQLVRLHRRLRSAFAPWLGGQDMQKWRPHITVQNKVARSRADDLYHTLSGAFVARSITVEGVYLWRYLGGPWKLESTLLFAGNRQEQMLQPE